jgi:hypothetical protein
MTQFTLSRLSITVLIFLLFPAALFAKCNIAGKDSLVWTSLVKKEYTLHYTSGDRGLVKNIDDYLQSGSIYIFQFFNHSFLQKFNVYIFFLIVLH